MFFINFADSAADMDAKAGMPRVSPRVDGGMSSDVSVAESSSFVI
jgi:hypothetical protein